jgi:alkylation response protein AidB-like acyl-CoA dehydrogenase
MLAIVEMMLSLCIRLS